MNVFEKRRNNAVYLNPPTLNGVTADIHITERGSDWLWAAFSMFALTTILILVAAYRKPARDRAFHYITAAITLVATIAYYSMASDLGFAITQVEFVRGSSLVSGRLRQIWYVRYIDWVITTPLLLLDILLTAGLPWPRILFVMLVDEVMIITGLVGSLTPSRYKWGYFTFGCAAMLYIFFTLIGPARRNAKLLGDDVYRAFLLTGVWTLGLWTLYPIAWGVSDGGNVISPDSEMVFYGVLDVLAKIGFSGILLWAHRNIDPARLGAAIRTHSAAEEALVGNGKNGHGIAGHHNGHGTAAGTAGHGTEGAVHA
ncbi:family A G protein-coupled receptor-like protein [Microthyrium microscopicum]|uniref:Family A G protein-coupled receptor-like protein n=1 Tax=Microthyrium microscopicum TaxID=703497 RepID=A0A6A6UC61_9PEZI|nr:family A G protein-coupled receptor-like protein [Microthyrium microscopicum]